MQVDRRDHLTGRIGDRRRDRGDPLVEFLECPGVAVAPDRPHPLEEGVRGHERPCGEPLHRPTKIALQERGRSVGEKDLAGRDRVEWDPRSRPVAHRHRVRAADLLDVVDEVSVGDAQSGGLADLPAPRATAERVPPANVPAGCAPRASPASGPAGSACRRGPVRRRPRGQATRAGGPPSTSADPPCRRPRSRRSARRRARRGRRTPARWTGLWTSAPSRLNSHSRVPSYGTVPHRGTPRIQETTRWPRTSTPRSTSRRSPTRAHRADAQRPL